VTKEEVEKIVDARVAMVLDQLTWDSEMASGVRLFQRPVRVITAGACKRVRSAVLEKWFKEAVK
jgi:hypothetical protein